MARSLSVAAVVVALVAVNAGYTVWALTLPAHPAEPFYMEIVVPPDIAQDNTAAQVSERMLAAGYTRTPGDITLGDSQLGFTHPDDPPLVVRAWGLGGAGRASLSVSARCMVSYFHTSCGGDDDAGLRARLAGVIEAAGLPLDARQAHYGDNDFETWGEFGLLMLQLLLAFVSAIALTIAYVLHDSATRRAAPAAFERPPGVGP